MISRKLPDSSRANTRANRSAPAEKYTPVVTRSSSFRVKSASVSFCSGFLLSRTRIGNNSSSVLTRITSSSDEGSWPKVVLGKSVERADARHTSATKRSDANRFLLSVAAARRIVFRLDEEAPEKQNAQDNQHRDDYDLYESHRGFLIGDWLTEAAGDD